MTTNTSNIVNSNIIDALGLQDLPAAKKTTLLAQMSQVIQDRVTDRIMEQLSAEERQQFDQILDQDGGQIETFLRKVVPDFDQIVVQETAQFKADMIADVSTLRAMVTKQ